jgi:hypothetical protein
MNRKQFVKTLALGAVAAPAAAKGLSVVAKAAQPRLTATEVLMLREEAFRPMDDIVAEFNKTWENLLLQVDAQYHSKLDTSPSVSIE